MNASAPGAPPRAPARVRTRGGAPRAVGASALYEGTIRHRRFAVRAHELRHRVALAYLDLDELPHLLGGRLLASRPGLVRFRRRDYLRADQAARHADTALPAADAAAISPADAARALAEAVRDTVFAQTGGRPDGPIRLLAHLRTWGHCFNPVSFYYCFDPSGETLRCVLAEVTNTPWGERHSYVLAPRAGGSTAILSGGLDKALHVSPFMGMDHRYEWSLTTPARTLSVHIASHRAGALAFDATLALQRRELTRASLARVTARYPLATLRVLALIYAHGAALKLKGVPLHPHPRGGAA